MRTLKLGMVGGGNGAFFGAAHRAAAAMTGRDATVDVATAGLVLVLGETALRTLLGKLLLLVQRGEPAGGGERTK